MYIHPLARWIAAQYNKTYYDSVQGAFSMKQRVKNSFCYALRRSVPILVGFLPLGTAYGILMAKAGYNFLWSGLASLVVYAGSLQMLMVGFLTASTPLLTVIVTSLLLNSRHIFYGLSFLERFNSYGAWKDFLIYGLPDESYSLLCSYVPRDDVEEKWVHIFDTALIWLYWIGFSMLGGLIGALLPFDMAGIDFALTALFIVIFLDQLKAGTSKLPAVVSIVASLLCLVLLGPDNFLLPALSVSVAALVLLRPRLEGKEAAQ